MVVGVIGLGVMGSAYAINLRKAGFDVIGHDPEPKRRQELAAAGVTLLPKPGDIALSATQIILSLPNARALEKVIFELREATRPDTIVIETSTLATADKIEAAQALGEAILLDCPVSGTGAQAHHADLIVFGSGDRAAFDRCLDIFKAISRAQPYLGDFGNGMRMKLIANHLVTIHNAAAGEAMALAEHAGIPLSTACKVLTESAGNSRMLQVRGPMMVEDSYDDATATIQTHLKDIDLISAFACQAGMPLPLFQQASQFYREADEAGFGQSDTAVVCRIARRRARSETDATS